MPWYATYLMFSSSLLVSLAVQTFIYIVCIYHHGAHVTRERVGLESIGMHHLESLFRGYRVTLLAKSNEMRSCKEKWEKGGRGGEEEWNQIKNGAVT